jgi:DNA-binding winged helix-turn-helix (wHTH) protein
VKLRFDAFVLDTDTRQLRCRGVERHLTPKAFDLLALLVENRPNAIEKAAIHKHLWPATFVSDANLAILIAEIRTALGDSARRPRYIRTVHRFGYAFASEAKAMTDSQPKEPARRAGWLTSKLQRFALGLGEHIVGRAEDADVCIDHESVSRRHARLVASTDRVTVEDLGSKNGTYVNHERVRGSRPLRDGDRVQFGSVGMTFRTRSSGTTTRSITPPVHT